MPRILVSSVPPPKHLKQQAQKHKSVSSAPYPKANPNAAVLQSNSKGALVPPVPPRSKNGTLPPLPVKSITPIPPLKTVESTSQSIQAPLIHLPELLPTTFIDSIPPPGIDVTLLPPLPSLPTLPALPPLDNNDIPVFPIQPSLPLDPAFFTPAPPEFRSPELLSPTPVQIPRKYKAKDKPKSKIDERSKPSEADKDPPRLSHARIAVLEDPEIKPYGCNAPGCAPSMQVMEGVHVNYARHIAAWTAENARLQADPLTQGQRPAGRHPSLFSVGVCFNSSRDLLDHLRDAHSMRQKGEVHITQLFTDIDVDPRANAMIPQDGRMFRCALVGCQRTWKNANGLQYHCLTSVTQEEHDTTTVRSRKISTVKKRKVEEMASDDTILPKLRRTDISILSCPYRDLRSCVHQFSDQQTLDEHLLTAHIAEPDVHHRVSTSPHLNSAPSAAAAATNYAAFASNAAQTEVATSHRRMRTARPHAVTPAIPQIPAAMVPQSGMYTHGYVFARGQAFRPHNRPIDALYFLNVLCAVGNGKTSQQRLSDRLIVNAMLNASFIEHLQDVSGTLPALVTKDGFVRPSPHEMRPLPKQDPSNPYTLEDFESAMLKISDVLERTGFGDPLSVMVDG